jgi:hypothetical protein
LFRERDYVPADCIRRQAWRDEDVATYYAQNTLMFFRRAALESRPELARLCETGPPLSLVHPRRYLEAIEAMRRLDSAARTLTSVIPPGECFILADQEQVRGTIAAGFRALPFLERNGQYYGTPSDDRTAVHECERMRAFGAKYMVFAWPAFWWVEHYKGFLSHLREGYPVLIDDELLLIFDLR